MEYILSVLALVYMLNSSYQTYLIAKLLQPQPQSQEAPSAAPNQPLPEVSDKEQEKLDELLKRYYEDSIGDLITNINNIMVGEPNEHKDA